MSTIQAARDIRDQLREQGSPIPWHECLRIAADCRREAAERAEARRAEWFARRREELRCERWLKRVREAPIITPCRHDGANGREGGWCTHFFEPEEEDAA